MINKRLSEASLEELEQAIALKRKMSETAQQNKLKDDFETELVLKFQDNVSTFNHEMNHIRLKHDALFKEAAELSEKFGIPCSLGDLVYLPKSLYTLFSKDGELPKSVEVQVCWFIDNGSPGHWWIPSYD